MERFNFSRDQDGNVTATDATKQAFGREFARSPGLAPRAVVNAAAADLVSQTKKKMLEIGKSYEECSRFLRESDPWLQVATARIGDDSCGRGMGIFVEDSDE